MHTYRRGLIGLLTIAPLVASGCSSSGSDAGSTTPAVSSTPGVPPTSPTVGTSPSETVTEQDLAAALLTPDEVGTSFSTAEFRPSSNPLPCLPNDLPLEQKYPARVRAGTALVSNRLAASMSQEIRLFAGSATADQALGYIAQGLNCRTGQLYLTSSAETVHFSAGQNVTKAVHADAAFAVQATATRFSILLVACLVDRALVLFSFLKARATPDSALPNPLEVVKAALDKIKTS